MLLLFLLFLLRCAILLPPLGINAKHINKAADKHLTKQQLSNYKPTGIRKRTASGKFRARKQLEYKNIAIYGGSAVIEEEEEEEEDSNGNNGNTNERIIFGTFYEESILQNAIPEILPELTEDAAVTIAMLTNLQPSNDLVSVELNIWFEDAADADADTNAEAQAVPYLVYVVVFSYTAAPQSYDVHMVHVFVDAMDGSVHDSYAYVPHFDAGCSDGGNEKVGFVRHCGSTAFEINAAPALSNDRVAVYDAFMDGADSNDALIQCLPGGGNPNGECEVDDPPVNGAYGVAGDAYVFGNVVFDLFADWMDGAVPWTSLPLRMNVHYGFEYENAFFRSDTGAFYFGDGKNVFHPLVALDVVAHEVAHGFTSQHSQLEYRLQSGGMNEAYSDLCGEAGEAYYALGGDGADWLVGADIVKPPYLALRSMIDPPLDGSSIDHFTDYNDIMDVHYSSGLYNKLFSQLSLVHGWTTRQIFAVASTANQVYWTQQSSFNQGVCGLQHALEDLYLEPLFGDLLRGLYLTCDLVGLQRGCEDLTLSPTSDGTSNPTRVPSQNPTSVPTAATDHPTRNPTSVPTAQPTALPSAMPSAYPTQTPIAPTPPTTAFPSLYPTAVPTQPPTTSNPTSVPTQIPTGFPTALPTADPTRHPTGVTVAPTSFPTSSPSVANPVIPVLFKTKYIITAAQSTQIHYQFVYDDNKKRLRFRVRGGTGDVDLYLAVDRMATFADYDCVSATPAVPNDEKCVLRKPAPATYYVMVDCVTEVVGAEFEIS